MCGLKCAEVWLLCGMILRRTVPAARSLEQVVEEARAAFCQQALMRWVVGGEGKTMEYHTQQDASATTLTLNPKHILSIYNLNPIHEKGEPVSTDPRPLD